MHMTVSHSKVELLRRLSQSRRLASQANDALTRDRLRSLSLEIEKQIAAADVRDAGIPPM
jgi:hypothetical protein